MLSQKHVILSCLFVRKKFGVLHSLSSTTTIFPESCSVQHSPSLLSLSLATVLTRVVQCTTLADSSYSARVP
jgi:hypothetical protein